MIQNIDHRVEAYQVFDVYVVHIDPDTGEIILIESIDDMVG